ncbi:MAG TPA: AraC family transcriptional regulator [Pyrinomonadaceae bacterium]|nr:AraC family transcriptional regulator [Pyrinomonadaceae bacterium]
MNQPKMSQFQGQMLRTISLDGITASETEYDYKFIDWHYHEHPYFALVTAGNCREINKRGVIDCSTDTLLFHNHHDPHCNAKAGGLSRHFQLELTLDWCRRAEIDPEQMPGSSNVLNPKVRLFFYRIYREAKVLDNSSSLTIDALLLQAFETMRGVETAAASNKPVWVMRIEEILHDSFDQKHSLKDLSDQLGLHPAHLSRDFSRYFRCGFSEYIRRIKVEKALAMLRNRKPSLTEIAAACGFADQSHFIRCFKEFVKVTPKAYRKIVIT